MDGAVRMVLRFPSVIEDRWTWFAGMIWRWTGRGLNVKPARACGCMCGGRWVYVCVRACVRARARVRARACVRVWDVLQIF